MKGAVDRTALFEICHLQPDVLISCDFESLECSYKCLIYHNK